jgi:[histone H3]-trimethyl-L-lysine9/36 demethylase
VPPPEWKPASSAYHARLHGLIVNGPIEQNIFGKGGVYECLHIQKKSLSLKEYKEKMGVFDRITDDLSADQVEEMVLLPLCSFGRTSSFPLPFTGPIC